MAIKIQPLLGDTPSNEVDLLITQSNNLNSLVGQIFSVLAAAADFPTFKTNMGLVDLTGQRTLTIMRRPPTQRQFPTQ